MYNTPVKHKQYFGICAALVACVGVVSSSSYSVIGSISAAEHEVETGQGLLLTDVTQEIIAPMHSAASASPDIMGQFIISMILILVGFAIGAYVALQKKKGISVFRRAGR